MSQSVFSPECCHQMCSVNIHYCTLNCCCPFSSSCYCGEFKFLLQSSEIIYSILTQWNTILKQQLPVWQVDCERLWNIFWAIRCRLWQIMSKTSPVMLFFLAIIYSLVNEIPSKEIIHQLFQNLILLHMFWLSVRRCMVIIDTSVS